MQTRFWEQWVEAQRSWWTMYGGFLPSMAAPAREAAKPASPVKPKTDVAPDPAHHHKHPPGIERKWPVASGPAAAKLRAQRKRAGLKPKEIPR